MKKSIHIALLCAAAAGNAAAAHLAVKPDSAAGYVFTVPAGTNNICGKVMDPDHPYGVVRGEDVCWAWEALQERNAIVDGAMPTERVSHVQGARVRRDHTGFSDGLPLGEWLDPDAPLIGIYPVVYEAVGCRTNTWTFTDDVYGHTNSLTVISMHMANGTVSAYTNAWTSHTVTGRVNVIHQDLDTVHVLGPDMLPLPLAPDCPPYGRIRWSITGPIFDTAQPRAHVFRETFKWLRATRRLDEVTNAGGAALCVHKSRYANGGGATSQQMTRILTASYTCTSNTWFSYDFPDTFNVSGDSRFTSALVTAGGVRRVEIEAAYLLIDFSYEDLPAFDPAPYERHAGTVAARLQTCELDTSGERAVVVATVTPEYLRQAGTFAFGIARPMPTGDYFAPVGHRLYWQSTAYGLAVVYKVTPSARFAND